MIDWPARKEARSGSPVGQMCASDAVQWKVLTLLGNATEHSDPGGLGGVYDVSRSWIMLGGKDRFREIHLLLSGQGKVTGRIDSKSGRYFS